jgi:hypothetical protein
MTFNELDSKLPNGFHDAEIRSISADYPSGSLRLGMNLWVGDLDGPNKEEYKSAELLVTGLYFYSIDPPDPAYPFLPDGSPVTVSGDSATAATIPALEKLLLALPTGVSCYRFFVHDWNSFIHIAANDVQISWVEESAQMESGLPHV